MRYRKLIGYWYNKLKYFGFRFKCPFCGGNFSKFLPCGLNLPVLKEKQVIGGGYRLNAVCPRCASTDRERLIYLYLKNKTSIFQKNIKVLHVAPEKELQKIIRAASNIDYLSSDLDSILAMVKMDITEIKYRDNFFDVIICNHVLEHIIDDYKAISELYRVLRTGGWAIIQVPISPLLPRTYEDFEITSPEEKEKMFGQSDHVRIYAGDYKDRLEKVGFSVEIYNYINEFGKSACRKYGLLEKEDLYICSKKR